MDDDAPMARPGEVAGWPKLVVRYLTDSGRIEDLLPPGLELVGDPIVQISVYCVPVHGEPELGISTKVPARFDGVDGQYCLGIGIDQEAAIFISRETNGQPKFPCSTTYFRLGDEIHASATHQGHTFFRYDGIARPTTAADARLGARFEDHEWWIKVSRAVGGVEKAYDFPPQVVDVRSAGIVTHLEALDGDLQLAPSPWDPYTDLLPVRGPATAELLTARHAGREITLAGPLDPDAFWPHADTIGGSRWPGERGGPRRRQ
jgi:acetoacetate decarboxylase